MGNGEDYLGVRLRDGTVICGEVGEEILVPCSERAGREHDVSILDAFGEVVLHIFGIPAGVGLGRSPEMSLREVVRCGVLGQLVCLGRCGRKELVCLLKVADDELVDALLAVAAVFALRGCGHGGDERKLSVLHHEGEIVEGADEVGRAHGLLVERGVAHHAVGVVDDVVGASDPRVHPIPEPTHGDGVG